MTEIYERVLADRLPEHMEFTPMTPWQKHTFETMNRRQVVALLEKAVMDNKIRDTVLFSYEGGYGFQLMDNDVDILVSYMDKPPSKKPGRVINVDMSYL